MKLADLSAATRQRIDKVKFDSSLEKHEGPYDWNWVFRTAEEENDLAFLRITSGTLQRTTIAQFYYRSIPNIMPILKWGEQFGVQMGTQSRYF